MHTPLITGVDNRTHLNPFVILLKIKLLMLIDKDKQDKTNKFKYCIICVLLITTIKNTSATSL